MFRWTRSFLATFPHVLLVSFLLIACGDDESSVSEKEGNSISAKKFASIDDLPECIDDYRGMVADVSGEYYACFSGGWLLLDKIVGGVCNIPACDDDREGMTSLTVSDGKVYRCKSGVWFGPDGKSTFAESDFVECFISAVIQDTVISADFLKNCNTSREGSLSVVGKDLVSCTSKEWVNVLDKVVSESDLPMCTENGNYVYVLSKGTAYECKDGVWYKGGKQVSSSSSKTSSSSSAKSSSDTKESSSSTTKESSSSKTNGSSSSVKEGSSSSKKIDSSSSASTPVDDGTKVRGVCMASVKEATKSDEVTYTFYNLGGTPLTFNWIFDESASPKNSSSVSPVVKYAKGGLFKAELIVNEGLESASDTIVCTSVNVVGEPIKGCKCTPERLSMLVKDDSEIMPVEWTVTGCSGGAPFHYEWGDTPIRLDSFSTWLPPGLGSFAPSLTVYNSDGSTMEPVCTAVAVTGPLSFTCSMNASEFNMTYQGGANQDLASFYVNVVSDDGYSSIALMTPYSSYTSHDYYENKDYTRYRWIAGATGMKKIFDKEPSPLTTYTAIFDGDTLCKATRVSCGPTAASNRVIQDSSATWSVFVDNKPYSASSYNWRIEDGKSVFESTASNPKDVYNNVGTATARVTLNKGEKDEVTLSCSDLTVVPGVKGCTCTGPTYKTSSNNISAISTVAAEWEISGCERRDDGLSYAWDFTAGDRNIFLVPDDTSARLYFNDAAIASPTATVSNRYGATQALTCPDAKAVKVTCAPSKEVGNIGESVTWSVSVEGEFEPSTYLWTFLDNNDDTMYTASTDATPETPLTKYPYLRAEVVLNQGLEDEYLISCPGVIVNKRPLTDCACGDPELLSESNNLAAGEVKYRWHVAGCETGGATPLTYTWSTDFTALESDESYANRSYTVFDNPVPVVTVTNSDGSYMTAYCEKAILMNAYCKPNREESEVGETVKWLFYFNTNDSNFGGIESFKWTSTDYDGKTVTADSANPEIQYSAQGEVTTSLVINEGLESEMTLACSTLTVLPKSITSCECDFDVTSGPDGSVVTWTVSGCQAEELMPLTYEWSDIVTPDPDAPKSASATFTESGSYRPTVTVTTAQGVELATICTAVNVQLGGED